MRIQVGIEKAVQAAIRAEYIWNQDADYDPFYIPKQGIEEETEDPEMSEGTQLESN